MRGFEHAFIWAASVITSDGRLASFACRRGMPLGPKKLHPNDGSTPRGRTQRICRRSVLIENRAVAQRLGNEPHPTGRLPDIGLKPRGRSCDKRGAGRPDVPNHDANERP